MNEADTASGSVASLSQMPTWNRSWPKTLTTRCTKTANTSKPFQFQQKQRCILRSSLMTMKKITASSTHKKSLLCHLLDLQGVQFFNLKIKR